MGTRLAVEGDYLIAGARSVTVSSAEIRPVVKAVDCPNATTVQSATVSLPATQVETKAVDYMSVTPGLSTAR